MRRVLLQVRREKVEQETLARPGPPQDAAYRAGLSLRIAVPIVRENSHEADIEVAFVFFDWLVPPKSQPTWITDARSLKVLKSVGDEIMAMSPDRVGASIPMMAACSPLQPWRGTSRIS